MKYMRQPKTTAKQKQDFILKHFPEVLEVKNIRMELDLIKNIRLAMIEAGMYATKSDKNNAGAEAAVIRLIIDLQYQSRIASNKIKKDIDLHK